MKVHFERRYFRNDDEWDYFLSQLNIAMERSDDDVEFVDLDVVDFTAMGIDGEELTI